MCGHDQPRRAGVAKPSSHGGAWRRRRRPAAPPPPADPPLVTVAATARRCMRRVSGRSSSNDSAPLFSTTRPGAMPLGGQTRQQRLPANGASGKPPPSHPPAAARWFPPPLLPRQPQAAFRPRNARSALTSEAAGCPSPPGRAPTRRGTQTAPREPPRQKPTRRRRPGGAASRAQRSSAWRGGPRTRRHGSAGRHGPSRSLSGPRAGWRA